MSSETELYRTLLELGLVTDDLGSVIQRAVQALVETVGSEFGLVEVFTDGVPLVATSSELDDGSVRRIQLSVSRGIIGEAIARGETVVTQLAGADHRFADLVSVIKNDIRHVLCAPVGGVPARGVVYLQGRVDDGDFTDEHRALTERFGRYLWPVVDRWQLQRRVEQRDDPTAPWRKVLDCADLQGRSEALAALLRELDQATPTELSVLLLGPSGTGKSHVARVVHRSSPRRAGPFVVVDCPSLPDTLFEAELFGTEPTAFTGAGRRDGLVRSARGGTLFLDEVGELSPTNQSKLLHFLETRQIRRLGSDRSEPADVRIVAATNRELVQPESGFRQDLYWRLAGFEIRVPSLDSRVQDVPLLARSTIARAADALKCEAPQLGPAAARTLLAHEWPGNIRQLNNIVERAVARAAREGARVLEPQHLFPEEPSSAGVTSFQEHTRRFQAELLASTLEATRWNVSEAARRLDLARSHVYSLIKAFGLEARKRP